ncbi:MAG: SulP family inorganic anion transporter [Desulfobacterales bacterium]|nr:SulP family inorganic anion transporter [Desulfobacterales bacterium]
MNRKNILSDLGAGFTTGLFSIPEGMAYAKLMGVNPVYGLYSSMVAPIVASLTTGTILMVSTLTSAIAICTGSVIQQAGIDVAAHPSALFTITFLVGAIMFLMGLLRLGAVVNYVSNAVMTGFVAGASLLILVGQLGDLTGYAPSGANKLLKVVDHLTHVSHWDPATTAVGFGTIIAMLVLKKIPATEKASAVIVLVLGTVVVNLLHLPTVELVAQIARIPNGLPTVVLPDPAMMPQLALGALSVALVALTQGAGIGTAVPNPDGSRASQSRDFMGQGLGNLAGCFFQSLGTGGSLSRTGISVSAGAKTRMAGVFSGLWLILMVGLMGSLAEAVPLSVIAGILMVVAVELIAARIPDAVLVWKTSKGSAAAGLLTFGSALFIPLQYTIFLGAGLSMALYIYASSRYVRLYQLIPAGDGQWAEEDPPQTYRSNEITVLQFDHMEFFAEVPLLEDMLPKRQGVNKAAVILIMRYIESLPSTTLKSMARYSRELQADGNLFLLAGVRPHILDLLERTGIIDAIGRENIFPAQRVLMAPLNEAVARANAWLDRRGREEGR